MNSEIQSNRDPGHGGPSHELSIAEQNRRRMMVTMKEGQGLLLHHQKDRVNELNVLCHIIELKCC